MTRRAPLPKITECVGKSRRVDRMRGSSLVWAVYPFVVLCALGIAHVHLQFQQSDLRLQQSHLQIHQRKLVREQGVLNREIEKLCNPDILKERARRDFHMVEAPAPSEHVTANVSRSLVAKYSAPAASRDSAIALAEIRHQKEKRGFEDTLLSLVDIRSANATALASR